MSKCFSTKCAAKIIVNFVMSKVSFGKYCRIKYKGGRE
jgi:hypothetical protein